MLELIDLVVLGIVSCLCAATVSIVAALVSHNMRNKDVANLYARVDSLEMAARGALGRANRDINKAEMEEALAQAAAVMANPEIKDKQAELLKIGLSHPNVALNLIKKGFKL